MRGDQLDTMDRHLRALAADVRATAEKVTHHGIACPGPACEGCGEASIPTHSGGTTRVVVR